MSNIILIGFMGSGKSTIAELLAQKTGKELVDLDAEITKAIGMPITEYFATKGEAAFREIESLKLAEGLKSDAIVATGGGIVVAEANRQLLGQHPTVVYLQTDPQVLVQRIREDQLNQRPLADEKSDEEIIQLFMSRIHHYEASATLSIDTTDKAPSVVVAEILERLAMV